MGVLREPGVVPADGLADHLAEIGEERVRGVHVVHHHPADGGEPGDGVVAERVGEGFAEAVRPVHRPAFPAVRLDVLERIADMARDLPQKRVHDVCEVGVKRGGGKVVERVPAPRGAARRDLRSRAGEANAQNLPAARRARPVQRPVRAHRGGDVPDRPERDDVRHGVRFFGVALAVVEQEAAVYAVAPVAAGDLGHEELHRLRRDGSFVDGHRENGDVAVEAQSGGRLRKARTLLAA